LIIPFLNNISLRGDVHPATARVNSMCELSWS
jgi:hypothetical protein